MPASQISSEVTNCKVTLQLSVVHCARVLMRQDLAGLPARDVTLR